VKLNTQSAQLTTKNLQDVMTSIKAADSHLRYHGLLMLVADVLDTAASGEDCYMTIGATRKRDALVVTVKQGNQSAYAAGVDFLELSEACESLTG